MPTGRVLRRQFPVTANGVVELFQPLAGQPAFHQCRIRINGLRLVLGEQFIQLHCLGPVHFLVMTFGHQKFQLIIHLPFRVGLQNGLEGRQRLIPFVALKVRLAHTHPRHGDLPVLIVRLDKRLVSHHRFLGLIEEEPVFPFQKHHVRRTNRLGIGGQEFTAQRQTRRVVFCPMFAQSIMANGIRALIVLLEFPQQLIQRLARFGKLLLRHLMLPQIKQQIRPQGIFRVSFQGRSHSRLGLRLFPLALKHAPLPQSRFGAGTCTG